jgi:hypothetical protein
MGTQCEILNSHGGKVGCGGRNLLTFQRKLAVSVFFHLEGGFRTIKLNITFLPQAWHHIPEYQFFMVYYGAMLVC